ncbi:MAG: sigma factor-like helix-turn-helix DNA-binding protein [Chloroflexota bacterium]
MAVGLDAPLEVLNLSRRSYNGLRRAGYHTVGEVAVLGEGELWNVHQLGKKSVAEIRERLGDYLSVRLARVSSGVVGGAPRRNLASTPLADPGLLDLARQKAVPIEAISVRRLGLSESLLALLAEEGIESVDRLARQPWGRWEWSGAILQPLSRYLEWLLAQQEPVWRAEVAGQGISPLHRLALSETSLENLVVRWLSPLQDRQRQIVRWRYGLDDHKLTLREVGDRLGVSRERVRQIQERALGVLGAPQSERVVRPFMALLRHLLEQHGGLINRPLLALALARELTVGAVDAVGVSRLALSFDTGVKWLRRTKAWGVQDRPLDELKNVQERLIGLLKKRKKPISAARVLKRFKATAYYGRRQEILTDDWLIACLMVHPDVSVDEDGRYSLKR